MAAKKVEENPLNYLGEEELEAIDVYSERFLEDMEKANIPEEKKQEYYEFAREYAMYSEAANSIDIECARISEKCQELRERYLNEQDDKKANKIAEEYNKNEAKYNSLMEKMRYFDEKCEQMKSKMESIDQEINLKLQAQKKNNQKRAA